MTRAWVLLAAVAALAVGCAQEAEQGGGTGPTEEGAPAPRPRADRIARAPGGGGAGVSSAAGTAQTGTVADDVLVPGGIAGAVPPDLPSADTEVIKTADLEVDIEARGFRDAMDTAIQTAARHGGFVVTSVVQGTDAKRGSVTLRVPADSFEDALAELRDLGTVQRERISGEDVSQEFVDLEARQRNLEAQEVVLLRLFDEAVSVADTIRIQRELSGVQQQIEEIEGRLRYLRDQTALSTITVALVEEGADEPGFFGKAWDAAVDGFLGVLSALVVVLGYAIPLVVLGLLVFLGYRWFRTRNAEEVSSPSGRGRPPRRTAPRRARRS
ncbi:MAG TPA: DUF4349 domain-containing protein [Actinomycetota bacterium]|nr:DUF4349 domain-containing protein [Actinomycetota bacterium]